MDITVLFTRLIQATSSTGRLPEQEPKKRLDTESPGAPRMSCERSIEPLDENRACA
jgi:hypothetical protein